MPAWLPCAFWCAHSPLAWSAAVPAGSAMGHGFCSAADSCWPNRAALPSTPATAWQHYLVCGRSRAQCCCRAAQLAAIVCLGGCIVCRSIRRHVQRLSLVCWQRCSSPTAVTHIWQASKIRSSNFPELFFSAGPQGDLRSGWLWRAGRGAGRAQAQQPAGAGAPPQCGLSTLVRCLLPAVRRPVSPGPDLSARTAPARVAALAVCDSICAAASGRLCKCAVRCCSANRA